MVLEDRAGDAAAAAGGSSSLAGATSTRRHRETGLSLLPPAPLGLIFCLLLPAIRKPAAGRPRPLPAVPRLQGQRAEASSVAPWPWTGGSLRSSRGPQRRRGQLEAAARRGRSGRGSGAGDWRARGSLQSLHC